MVSDSGRNPSLIEVKVCTQDHYKFFYLSFMTKAVLVYWSVLSMLYNLTCFFFYKLTVDIWILIVVKFFFFFHQFINYSTLSQGPKCIVCTNMALTVACCAFYLWCHGCNHVSLSLYIKTPRILPRCDFCVFMGWL